MAVLLLAIAVDLPLAYAGSGNVAREAHSLKVVLTRDEREGVPLAALSPLRQQLARVQSQPWYSPTFWFQPRGSALTALRQSAAQAFTAAVTTRREQAQAYLTEYRSFASANMAWLTPSEASQSSGWSATLAEASTPGDLRSLAVAWKSVLTKAEASAKSSAAAAAASVTLTASSTNLMDQATAAESLASAAGLSELAVPRDVSALQRAQAAGQPGTAQIASLSTQLQALLAEIGLQQQVANLQETVVGLVDQASFEQLPNAAAFQTQLSSSGTAIQGATTVNTLGAAQGSLRDLQSQVRAVLAANSCGHSAISGKSIYISISLEEMIFYDNGCVVNATPVTTGRPGETTPTGTFSIFLKRSPLEFISGYAPGSPNYYTPFLAQYAMEFLAGGYYLHNAPWEPADAFGPRSEANLSVASHGCVHTPLATLAWAYSWTPLGTPVVVSA
jgi:lipoprotein-anchoring transpeptidase ErfK/SrfK